jgi:hypothetical protein
LARQGERGWPEPTVQDLLPAHGRVVHRCIQPTACVLTPSFCAACTAGTLLPPPPHPDDEMTILPVNEEGAPPPPVDILPGVPTPDDNMTVLPLLPSPRDENGTLLLPPPPPHDGNVTDLPVPPMGPDGELLPPPPPQDVNDTLIAGLSGKSGKSGKSGSKSGKSGSKSDNADDKILPGVPTPEDADVAPAVGVDAVQDQTTVSAASRSPALNVAVIAGVAFVGTIMVVLAAVGVRKLYKKKQGM